MLLKAGNAWKKWLISATTVSGFVSVPSFKNINGGNISSIYFGTDTKYQKEATIGITDNGGYSDSNNYGCRMWVGTSDQAEDYDDYQLYSPITTGLTASNQSITRHVDGDKVYLVFTRDFTNNSGSTITINEVGLVKGFWVNSGSFANALLVRNVEAIEIENGATRSISIVVEF